MSREPIKDRFARDIASHVMEIRHDEELYRHVVFKRPNTVCMMFSLTTTPGRLIYAGDMGCFVFERLPDMFMFFGSDEPDREPNFGYWHEKLVAIDRDGSMEHDADQFRDNLKSYLTDDLSEQDREAVNAFISEVVNEFEEQGPQVAYASVAEFSLDHGPRNRRQFFEDFWDHSDRVFTVRYEWACYAIRFGIWQYQAATTAVVKETGNVG